MIEYVYKKRKTVIRANSLRVAEEKDLLPDDAL